jgi:membrane associated rhomboid family serine protease
MDGIGVTGLLIILATIYVSYKGFKSSIFFNRYRFEVGKIKVQREYERIFTSAFLHANWTHLLFNMVALYCFSQSIEIVLGPIQFVLLYLGSLVGGNLLSLFIQRNHYSYKAIGASGGVCGIIFSSIAMDPNMRVGMFFLPISIPGWLFALLFTLYSIFGIRSGRDNIGHDAHLGGGITGLLICIILFPQIMGYNFLPILCVLIPALLFFYLLRTKPHFLLVDNPFSKTPGTINLEDKYNEAKRLKEKELDYLLEKIHTKGIESLSKKEKEKLQRLSR